MAWVGFHPLYNPTNQGVFRGSSDEYGRKVNNKHHLQQNKSPKV